MELSYVQRLNIERKARLRRLNGEVLIRDVLNVATEVVEKPITIISVMREIALAYNITVVDLQSDSRVAHIMRPRHIAAWLAKRMTGRSFSEIGRKLYKDHTTIMHAVRRIEQMRAMDIDLQNTLDYLEVKVRGAHNVAI